MRTVLGNQWFIWIWWKICFNSLSTETLYGATAKTSSKNSNCIFLHIGLKVEWMLENWLRINVFSMEFQSELSRIVKYLPCFTSTV